MLEPMANSNHPSRSPVLAGAALDAVRHRGSHMQIIASAGSGKTEVVSQRVADLLADGLPAESIVAFTFTERAAEELKNRISERVEDRLGPAALDRLGAMFVGTIHAFCFRLLQQKVPRYETFDVLDDNQLTAFLSREASRLQLRQLDDRNRLFAAIAAFQQGVDVVENELLDTTTLPDPFGSVLLGYYETLERYRLLTYGQQVVRAVTELQRPELIEEMHDRLRHLIVDEYQDVNPAQERLIELLTGPKVELCVVGDDQQAIYQWRGSDVSNIVDFTQRYSGVATFEITTNRRSRPQIVGVANTFGATIPGSLQKTMHPNRPTSGGPEAEVVAWSAPTETEEAGWIASLVLDLADAGTPFRDMAILVRSRAAYARLMEQFATFDIPVQPGGRTGLFDQPEALTLGHTVSWLADNDWRDRYGPPQRLTDGALFDEYQQIFQLSSPERHRLGSFLRQWKSAVPLTNRTANLVGELYELLSELNVRSWDLSDPIAVNRLGTLARFSSLLADYESVRRRARPDPDAPGEQVGGQDRGIWYYRNLALHIINYAQGAYEGFDGEPDFAVDAVDLTTVHRAKGLEWPVVFVPSVTAGRFPSSRTGQVQPWLVPRTWFDAARYEGSDADERRLFYVALTRARDWLSVSRHERVTSRRVAASPYYQELAAFERAPDKVQLPVIESPSASDAPISLTFSQLAAFLDCGMAFRLRELIGFEPRLATELGYGKAVHHVMRAVAEATRARGRVPTTAEVDDILQRSFFLPTANKSAHRQLRDAAHRLVMTYTRQHAEDLHRVWETERPFELHLPEMTVTGRADVILDHEGGTPTALAIVDYKTSTTSAVVDHALQLQVYADAGRREGLDVQAAYVHDLKAASRATIEVEAEAVQKAEQTVSQAAARLKARDYQPNPGQRCRRCEVRTICRFAR